VVGGVVEGATERTVIELVSVLLSWMSVTDSVTVWDVPAAPAVAVMEGPTWPVLQE
jgi:hypothetical protein